MRGESIDFLVNKTNLRETRWSVSSAPNLKPGQIRVRVDQFALTANNITYALYGEKLRYWHFFPAPEGFGRVPVWGFGVVEESRLDGVVYGQRIYGYFPISRFVDLTVGKMTDAGFFDVSPWRANLASVYNKYLYAPKASDFDALEVIFKPLFATSFLLQDFLKEHDFFGTRAVMISSASSKTALTLAYLLKQGGGKDVKVIALTSPVNAGFVKNTGYFDEVVSYDHIRDLPVAPSVYVDVAGSAKVRSDVHYSFADSLKYSCAVGGAHWEDPGRAKGLPGAKPVMFFAPAYAEKRIKDWGNLVYEQNIQEQCRKFYFSASNWLEHSLHSGTDAIEGLYYSVLEGQSSPRSASMASF